MYSLVKRIRESECWHYWKKDRRYHRRKILPAVDVFPNNGIFSCNQFSEYWFYGFNYISNGDFVEIDRILSIWDLKENPPTLFFLNGTKQWHYGHSSCDCLHSAERPAVIYPNGDYEWWFMGSRHRLDGPAVVYGDKQYWFEYGKFVKCIV
jgi:hypothetical protein